MIKVVALFEHEVAGKKCNFIMDHDTPISVGKEMAFAFLKYLGQIEDEANARAAKEQQKIEALEKLLDEVAE